MSNFSGQQSPPMAPSTALPGRTISTALTHEPLPTQGALSALFARASRNSERVIFRINDSAFESAGARPAFYCIHSLSGAGGTDFSHLARLLPDVRFYGIQAPPKKMSDAEFGRSVSSIADYYADALINFQPNGPFLLGGWSAGAIIGLEIAQNLRVRGRDVALFVAIDAVPENTSAAYGPWHPVYVLELISNVPSWFVSENPIRIEGLRSMVRRTCKKMVALVRISLADKAGHAFANGFLVEGFMDLSRYPDDQKSFMKRLYNALLEYAPKTYAGNVVAYEAQIKPLLRLPQVGRVWGKIAPGAKIVSIRGTHLSILREDDVSALAEDLKIRIAQTISEAGSKAGNDDPVA